MAEEETAELEEVDQEQRARLLWNELCFLELGFLPEIAELLAQERVDWHRAEVMLKRGCTHNTVLRILL